ncbi:hypothetical protein A3I99_03945 [Candidatus Kaiserbacteria bacterium RIFCSPLOWO2_02_FULL_45_11b]|uniref:Uncharacterized protein n=1 Tax=Candidatus Kaiserbacteria bacterium RIFCSPLOWO2_12_FULL_45_26 TaxID=1798525 RepID=A0A1F6FH91_9BACT|nr:MAG: hypothetical protein A2929_02825 [Candidatus Kaiserbacteria bacterium RIFCSPLOWO2_01_FULL_45_25]OGG83739.1 MAG: hypothetical protein A3I99_03945 [Candidatus Kaiserbacteria bacterium RIFCSPLOWO2_02_FULL_45_11b]OGG85234.1 MAG: hypothetical protein A3G90_04225 [Candidatus Kaiserbacteria bacterium RIFCSPLOWO2_12_FULL_45_26]
MWKNLALTPRISFSIIWSIPIWIFLDIQDQNWFPSAVIDLFVMAFFSFVIEHVLLYKWLRLLNNRESRRQALELVIYICYLLMLFALVLLLFLVTFTSNTEELQQKAFLVWAYVLLATLHIACKCTKYSFGRYGAM